MSLGTPVPQAAKTSLSKGEGPRMLMAQYNVAHQNHHNHQQDLHKVNMPIQAFPNRYPSDMPILDTTQAPHMPAQRAYSPKTQGVREVQECHHNRAATGQRPLDIRAVTPAGRHTSFSLSDEFPEQPRSKALRRNLLHPDDPRRAESPSSVSREYPNDLHCTHELRSCV